MYDKAFIINVNKCLKPFFIEQHIDIVNRVTLQSFWLISNVVLFVFPTKQQQSILCIILFVI